MLLIPVFLYLLWNVIIIYVFIDVRRVMAFNNKAIEQLFGTSPLGVSDRGVLINRVLLAALLVVSNWAVLRYLVGI
jgi:hypothetical protein